MFGQFRRAALQIALTHFDYRQEFVSLAFPFRFLVPAAKPVSQKTQIMRAPEQTTGLIGRKIRNSYQSLFALVRNR